MTENQPYNGINLNSYGSLRMYVDSTTGLPTTPPSCDPNAKYTDVDELSRRLTAYITSPLQREEQIDPSIKLEGLQNSFRMPGDLGGYNVTLLDRSHDYVVFWYRSQLVILPEVNDAARLYCSRFGRQATYLGSSRQCSQPEKMPVAINGQSEQIETYVISAFQCAVTQEGEITQLPAEKVVWQIQLELKRLGYLTTRPDGLAGLKTRAAIKSFQQEKGITVDGNPNEVLLQILQGS